MEMRRYPYEGKTFEIRQQNRLDMLRTEFHIRLDPEDKLYLMAATNDIQAEQRMRSIYNKYL